MDVLFGGNRPSAHILRLKLTKLIMDEKLTSCPGATTQLWHQRHISVMEPQILHKDRLYKQQGNNTDGALQYVYQLNVG